MDHSPTDPDRIAAVVTGPAEAFAVITALAAAHGLSVAVRTRAHLEDVYGRPLTDAEWAAVSGSAGWIDAEWAGGRNALAAHAAADIDWPHIP